MPNKYNYNIDPDISKSETLPSSFYKDPNVFEDIKSKIFLKSWQWIGDTELVPKKNYVYPLTVLNKYLSEPVIVSRTNDNDIICLTNVCTHRGNIMVLEPGEMKKLSMQMMIRSALRNIMKIYTKLNKTRILYIQVKVLRF